MTILGKIVFVHHPPGPDGGASLQRGGRAHEHDQSGSGGGRPEPRAGCRIVPTDAGKDVDRRDYQVSYAKIQQQVF